MAIAPRFGLRLWSSWSTGPVEHRREPPHDPAPPIFASTCPVVAVFLQTLRHGPAWLGSPNPLFFLLLALILELVDALLHALKGVFQILRLAF
jgi:hypothetical protein